MTIEVMHKDSVPTFIELVNRYDFYPETRMLFVECTDNEVIYIPINENVERVRIMNGTERGYLEGHDEAR